MTLSEKEYELLNKISNKSKQDWFLIGQNPTTKNDFVVDLENDNQKLKLGKGVKFLLDGAGEYITNDCTQKEKNLLLELLIKLL